MTDTVNIYQRIGEALASKGEYTIIRSNSDEETTILKDAGFVQIGSMKEGDIIVSLYKLEQKVKEVIKIVEAPAKQTWPWDKTDPFNPNKNTIWYYNDQNPLYTNYTSKTTDVDHMKYRGSTTSFEKPSIFNDPTMQWSDLDNGFNMSAEMYKLATFNLPKNK